MGNNRFSIESAKEDLGELNDDEFSFPLVTLPTLVFEDMWGRYEDLGMRLMEFLFNFSEKVVNFDETKMESKGNFGEDEEGKKEVCM